MGQKNSSQSNKSKGNSDKNDKSKNKSPNIVLQRNTFDFLYVIGKGGFGKVIYL